MSKLFLDQSKIGELLCLAKDHPRDLALFHVSVSTGLRISDVLRLRVSQFRDNDGEVVRAIRIRMKKTKKWIGRPLREDCREAVRQYLATRDDDNPFLFPPESNNSQGSHAAMNRSSVHRLYKKYLSELFPRSLLVGNSTHLMRRSVAQLVSAKAGRLESAQAFLGHASIASTAKYIDSDGFEQKADDIVMNELHF